MKNGTSPEMALENYRNYLFGWKEGLGDAQKIIQYCRSIPFMAPLIEGTLLNSSGDHNVSSEILSNFTLSIEGVANKALTAVIDDLKITVQKEIQAVGSVPVTLETTRELPPFAWKKGLNSATRGYTEGINGALNQILDVKEALAFVDLTQEYEQSSNPLRNGTIEVDFRIAATQQLFDNLSYDVTIFSLLHAEQVLQSIRKGLSSDQIVHQHDCWSTLVLFGYEDDTFMARKAAKAQYSDQYMQAQQVHRDLPRRPLEVRLSSIEASKNIPSTKDGLTLH